MIIETNDDNLMINRKRKFNDLKPFYDRCTFTFRNNYKPFKREKKVLNKYNIEVGFPTLSYSTMKKFMKDQLELTFKNAKVRYKTYFTKNNEISVIWFISEMAKYLKEKLILFYFDETTINNVNYHRYSWWYRGQKAIRSRRTTYNPSIKLLFCVN